MLEPLSDLPPQDPPPAVLASAIRPPVSSLLPLSPPASEPGRPELRLVPGPETGAEVFEQARPTTLANLPGYELVGFNRCAGPVGGDFYDVVPLRQGAVLLAIADVMGNGLRAATYAWHLRNLLREEGPMCEGPANLMGLLNLLMYDELARGDAFITMQLALIESNRKRMEVASAGHCPLLVAKGDSVASVAPEGMPLGIEPHSHYEAELLPLSSFQRALLYTDGLTEAKGADGQRFGQRRLERWLAEAWTPGKSAAAMRREFLKVMDDFHSPALPNDDQTFLLLSQSTPDRLQNGLPIAGGRLAKQSDTRIPR